MRRPVRLHYESGITRFEEHRYRGRVVRVLALGLLILLLLWTVLPLARAGLLLATNPFRPAPPKPAGLPVRPIRFHATDGVLLSGWFVPSAARSYTVILVAGFKADRTSMVPYARFLHDAGFNVLLYDSRGTGASGGTFTLGLREVHDVQGAVAYLNKRPDLRYHHYGLLGVSLGAGIAIVAASRLPSIVAIVADSPYTDQRSVVQRLDMLQLGPLTVPLAPFGPWLVDRVIGAALASFSPLHSARKIPPRALLLIHSRHDRNPTTPLRAAVELQHAAGRQAFLWRAPRGGHAGALAGQPLEYRNRVIAFFRRYLH